MSISVVKPDLFGFSGQIANEFVEEAKKANVLDQMRSELLSFRAFCDEAVETDPDAEEMKLEELENVKDTYCGISNKLLSTIFGNDEYLKDFDAVIDDIEALCEFEKGEVQCTVRSAQELTTEQYDRLYAKAKALCDSSVKTLNLSSEVEPNLLGGFTFSRAGPNGFDLNYSLINQITTIDGKLRQ